MKKLIEYIIEERKAKQQRQSDQIKYMMCGEAMQNNICRGHCYNCAWYTRRIECEDNSNGDRS